MKARYVDDIASPAQSVDERDRQIHDVTEVISHGGFSSKFIVKSGMPPPETASSDGQFIKFWVQV